MARLIDITGKALSGEWGNDDTDGTGIPVLRTTNFTNDGIVNYEAVVTRSITKKDLTQKFLRNGDIIIEKSGGSDKQPVGRVIYFDGPEETYLFNNFTGVLRIKDRNRWHPRYVFYSLYANYQQGGTRRYENRTTGLHNLQTDQYVSELEIAEVSLQQQQVCISILDYVSRLINLRKQQIAKLDELVKARFVEMFGDPILNDKEFPMLKGEDFFKLSNGKAVPEDKRFTEGIPAFGGNGISWYTDTVMHTEDTLVVGRVGFQSGNVHLAKGPLWVTDNAMYMSACRFDLYNLVFLCALMEHIDFTRYQDAGDLKKVTQKPFMQMSYIQPPMKLQEQFAAFVAQTDQQKLTIQHSLAKLELLKKALMQKYFG